MVLGYVYKIFHNSLSMLPYIGSTCQCLSSRLNQHRTDYRRFLRGKASYISIFKLFGDHDLRDFKIIELERLNIDDKQELRKCEDEWIGKIECVNKNRAYTGITKDEYNKIYYKKNVDKWKQYNCKRYVCELCDFSGDRTNYLRHIKTKKHLINLFAELPFYEDFDNLFDEVEDDMMIRKRMMGIYDS